MKSHKTNPADDDDDKHTVYESKARHDHGTGAEDEPGMDGEELCEEAEEEDDGVDESMAHLDNANDPDDAAADQQHVQADPGSVVMTNMGFEQSDDEGPLEDAAENDASSLLLQNIDVNVLGETVARGFRLRNIWIRKRRIESFKARQASLMVGGGGGGGVLDAVQSSGHKHAEFDGQNSASDGIEHAHVEADNGTENVDDNDEESDAAAVKAVIASIVHSVSNEMDGAAGFGMEVDDGDVFTARAPSPSNNDEVQQNAVVNNNNNDDDRSSVFETNTTTTELGVVDDADNNVNSSSSSGARLRWTLIGHWGRTELFKEVVKRELKLFGKNGNFSYYYKCCAEQCAYKLRASRLRYVAGDAFNVHELGTHSGEHPLPRHGKKSGISLSSECVRKRVNKEHRKLDERACRMARSCSSFEYKWLGVSNSWFKEELDQFVEDQELQLYTWLGLSKLYYRCTKRPEPNDFPCPFRLRATLNKEENEEGNEPSSTDTYTISESYEWHSHQTEMVRRKRNVLQRVRLFEWEFLREIDDPQTLDKFRREHYVYAPVDDFDLLVQGTLACQWEPRQQKDTTPKCPYRMLVYKEFADGPLKVYEKGHHVHEQPPMLKPCEPIRPNRRHQKNALSKRIKMSRIESRRRERLRQKLRGDVKAVVQSMVTSVVHQLDGVEMLKQIVVGKKRKTKSGGGRRRRRRRTAVQTRSAKRSKMEAGDGSKEDDGIEAGGSGDSVSQRMGAYLLDSSSDEAPPVEQRAAVGPQRERRRRRASFLGIGTRLGAYLDISSSDEAEVCPDEEVDKALNVPLADDVVVDFHACPCPDQLLEDDTDMENDTGRGEQRIDQHESIETVVQHNVDIVSERDDDDDRPRPLLSTPNVPTNEERDRQMLFAVGMRASPVIEIANFEGIAMRRSFKVDPEDMNKGMINNNCELVVGEEDLPDDRTMMQMKRSNTVNNRSVGRSSNKPKQKMTTINNHRRKGSTRVRKAVKLIREKGTGMKKTKKKPVRKRLPLKRSREQSTKSREENVVVRKKLRTSTTVQTATKTTTHTVVDRRHERRSSLMSAKKSHNKNTTTKQRVEEVQKLKHTAAADHHHRQLKDSAPSTFAVAVDHHPVDHHRQLTHSAPLASAAYVPPYPYSSIGTKHRTPPSSSTSHHHQHRQQQQHNSIFFADDLLRQHGFGTVVIQQPIFSLSDADTMVMLKQIGAEQRVSLVERSGSFLFIPPKGSVHYLGGKLLALTHSTDHIRVDEFREGNLVGTVERWPRTIDALPLFIKHLHQKLKGFPVSIKNTFRTLANAFRRTPPPSPFRHIFVRHAGAASKFGG
uniref:C2H2-type domain-containing protein n=1 Tax=Globodera pallida TaxID=36090 RepID=A0A183CDM5_GLOPA